MELWKRKKSDSPVLGGASVGYYLSTLEEEEKNAVVASAENHTVQKLVCDHRYGKYSLYALTTGVVFEYDLKRGEGLVPV